MLFPAGPLSVPLPFTVGRLVVFAAAVDASEAVALFSFLVTDAVLQAAVSETVVLFSFFIVAVEAMTAAVSDAVAPFSFLPLFVVVDFEAVGTTGTVASAFAVSALFAAHVQVQVAAELAGAPVPASGSVLFAAPFRPPSVASTLSDCVGLVLVFPPDTVKLVNPFSDRRSATDLPSA